MKKKIFKYIKVVMACLLIASLTLPSYAAVSASDGSAFVTKAEFDAALSDFNARLTTFEAGINSKIDSQVSSYLDRNGIWNGRTQTLDNSGCSAFAKLGIQKNYNVASAAGFFTADGQYKEDNKYYAITEQVGATGTSPLDFRVENPDGQFLTANKSGLINMKLKLIESPMNSFSTYPIKCINAGSHRSTKVDGESQYGMESFGYRMLQLWELKPGAAEKTLATTMLSETVNLSWFMSAGPYPGSEREIDAFTFVSKDSKYYLAWDAKITNKVITGYWSYNTTNPDKNQFRCYEGKVLSAKIY